MLFFGCDTKKFRTQDSIKLIEYAFNTYEMVNIHDMIYSKFNLWKTDSGNKFNIIKGTSNNLDVSLADIEYTKIPIKKEDLQNIIININCSYNLESPVLNGTPIGKLTVSIKDDVLYDIDIIATNTIKRKSYFNYLIYLLKNIPSILETNFIV